MSGFRATFSNGHVAEIAQSRKPYTHAWHWCGIWPDQKDGPHMHGFSTSAERAARNMAIETRNYRKNGMPETFSEIVAVEVTP
jgi:hypothetical protein